LCEDFGATYQAHFDMALGIGLVAGLLAAAITWIAAVTVRQRWGELAGNR